MPNCDDPRNKCGEVLPSACVTFTGDKPSFVLDADFPCTVNVDDIIKQLAITIQKILTSIDYTGLQKRCLTFDPATVTSKQLEQIEIDEICALKASLQTLQTQLDGLNIATKLITLNLGCMTPVSNPCSSTLNSYSLYYILNTLVTNVCAIKQNLGI